MFSIHGSIRRRTCYVNGQLQARITLQVLTFSVLISRLKEKVRNKKLCRYTNLNAINAKNNLKWLRWASAKSLTPYARNANLKRLISWFPRWEKVNTPPCVPAFPRAIVHPTAPVARHALHRTARLAGIKFLRYMAWDSAFEIFW